MAFQKGQSGNPGGRPKLLAHVRDLAREHTEDAIRELATILTSGEHEASRVAAAKELLDRGWGKAAQALTGEDGEGPIVVKVVRFGDAA
jgi:hypothetical protein